MNRKEVSLQTTYKLCPVTVWRSLAKADLFPAEIGLDQSVYQICSAATYVAAMQSSDRVHAGIMSRFLLWVSYLMNIWRNCYSS